VHERAVQLAAGRVQELAELVAREEGGLAGEHDALAEVVLDEPAQGQAVGGRAVLLVCVQNLVPLGARQLRAGVSGEAAAGCARTSFCGKWTLISSPSKSALYV
jgi:hypothetical protein